MKFVLLTVPSASEEWNDLATQLYFKKINHFIKLERAPLKSKKNSRSQNDEKVRDDSEAILKELAADDYVVLLDEKGNSFDSIQFSKKLENIFFTSKKRCVFLIGGAFGVSEDVKKRANLKIALAPFVMNHLVAEVVFLEQLYRGLTILKNIPYHNA